MGRTYKVRKQNGWERRARQRRIRESMEIRCRKRAGKPWAQMDSLQPAVETQAG